jgi:hypothetical protein
MFEASKEAVSFDVIEQLEAPNELEAPDRSTLNAQARNEQWVRDRLAADSDLARDYLRAVAAYPWLFRQYDLPSIVGHVEGVLDHFRPDGLTREDYLQVVASDPPLVLQKAAVVINNIEQVLAHFRDDGLSRSDYIQAALDQPILFRMRPQTVIDNITDLEEWLAHAVTGTPDCLRRAVDRPRLFTMGADALGSISIEPTSDVDQAIATTPTGQSGPQGPSQAAPDAACQEIPATQVIARAIQELTRVPATRGRAA